MTEDYIQVLTATASRDDAQRIATALVELRLAACVQVIGPIASTYWWQGRVEQTEEWLCLIKSRRALYTGLEQAIRARHPYETPEIIAMPVVAGSPPYLHWLSQEVRQA
ncbi:MAG TPA: divalent-cation tolerance protein CutA [Alphaproteobacteria bacterium]|nr:divalent-cation tolerance protein CutA [Alphaproteobacteria bacterium]